MTITGMDDTVPGEAAPGNAVSGGDLKARWLALRDTERGVRTRDAAARLGVSDAELLARCGEGVTRLRGPWGDILKRLPELGEVMVLTRNDYAVHEKTGTFDKVKIMGAMGLVLDRAIDLRLLLGQWATGFAVAETAHGGVRRSLQFFDATGTAVHKVYLRDASDPSAFDRLVAAFTDTGAAEFPAVAPMVPPAGDRPDDTVDRPALRARWQALQDVHDFHAMLNDLEVSRTQALRLVGDDLAYRVDTTAFRGALDRASAASLSVMIFVGSPGVVQIHTGPVVKLKTIGPWFNVLDADFNLHLREDGIATAWVVRKPTRDGLVSSLEIYDAAGGQIAWMFGERQEGQPEMAAWRELLTSLPALDGSVQ